MYNGDEPESDATNQLQIQPRPPKGAWTIRKKYLGFMVTSQMTLALRQPWVNGKRNHPGILGNIMNRPTVCISSKVKEPHNITGFEEPQGAVETEDLFQQGKSMKPPPTRQTQLYGKNQIPPVCQGTERVNSHQHQSGMVLSISILRLNNSMHGYFDTPSALSSFKIWQMQSRKDGILQSVMDPTKTSWEQHHGE
jgi:hypothetical protein